MTAASDLIQRSKQLRFQSTHHPSNPYLLSPPPPQKKQVLDRDNNAAYNAIQFDAAANQVRARIPLYGYLMLQQALAGGADVLARSSAGGCKVWLLQARKSGDLRAVVINTDGKKGCGVDVRLTAEQMKRYGGAGEAHYMYASGGLSESWRVYYSGSYYTQWGSARETPEQLAPVQRYLAKDKAGKVTGAGFAFEITDGTVAALVTIPVGQGQSAAAAAAAAAAEQAQVAANSAAARLATAAARAPSAQAVAAAAAGQRGGRR
jgi:hypothetical protein